MPHCVKCGVDLPEDARFCIKCGSPVTPTKKGLVEEFSVATEDLVERVKELIHEGNVRRIIVKNGEGKTVLVIPVTAGLIGVLLAPWMAALGVVAALATRCTILVEREEE